MPITRAPHNQAHPYTVISNALINDPTLSLAAKMVLIYLLSKPNDWNIRADDIQQALHIGKDKTYHILDELIQHGYLTRTIIREKGRITKSIYTVSEQPVAKTPDTGNQETENQDNYKVITLPSNEELNKREITLFPDFQEQEVQIPDHLQEYVKAYVSPKTNNLVAYRVTQQDLQLLHRLSQTVTPEQLARFIKQTLRQAWWENTSVSLSYIVNHITGDQREYTN